MSKVSIQNIKLPFSKLQTIWWLLKNIVAAFLGKHVSPLKHSYAWLPRKCDYRTDTQTDRQTPDKVIPMCRYALQATQLRSQDENNMRAIYWNTVDSLNFVGYQFSWFSWRVWSTNSSITEMVIFCMNYVRKYYGHKFWNPRMCHFCSIHENLYTGK